VSRKKRCFKGARCIAAPYFPPSRNATLRACFGAISADAFVIVAFALRCWATTLSDRWVARTGFDAGALAWGAYAARTSGELH
jgi:hypothetical protein